MAQFASASSDITNPANITGDYTAIDETSFSDADYIYSLNNTNVTYEFLFSTVPDPGTGSGHIVRFRHAQSDDDAATIAPSSGGSTSTLSAYLYQGGTLIATLASGINSNEGSFTEVSYTLSAAEANSITDYSDLRTRFDFVGGGGGPANRRGVAISWAQLEVPDYVPSTYNESITLALTGSISDSAIATFNNNTITLSFNAEVTGSGGTIMSGSITLTMDSNLSLEEQLIKLFKMTGVKTIRNIKFLR